VIDTFILLLITFFGAFTQSVSGFGIGLILMPAYASALGLGMARPLVTLIGTTTQVVVMYRNRRALTFGVLGLISILGLVGVVIGNWIAESQLLPENTLRIILAIIICGYALYALFSPTLPQLKTDRWGGFFGLLSGILTGTYNTGGPPVIIYADARRWTPAMLRSNLSGFFMIKGFLLMFVHYRSQNFTPEVMNLYYINIPLILLGLVLGFAMYGRINAARFRQIVLVLLFFMGLNIIRGVFFG